MIPVIQMQTFPIPSVGLTPADKMERKLCAVTISTETSSDIKIWPLRSANALNTHLSALEFIKTII